MHEKLGDGYVTQVGVFSVKLGTGWWIGSWLGFGFIVVIAVQLDLE